MFKRRAGLKVLAFFVAAVLLPACGSGGGHGSGAAAPVGGGGAGTGGAPPPAPPAPPAPAIPAPTLKDDGGGRFSFAYPDLEGRFHTQSNRAAQQSHGVEFTKGVDGQRVMNDRSMNVENYHSSNMQYTSGVFVPRFDAAVTVRQVGDGGVEITLAPAGGWNITTQVTYTLLPDRVIKAEFAFTFTSDYPNFEAFVSNYFPGRTEPHVPLAGKWVKPAIPGDRHYYWLRDAGIQALMADGRKDWIDGLGGATVKGEIRPEYYDHPILITPTSAPDWYVIHIIERVNCPSLSANTVWSAHDFSLVGRDVKAGQTVTAVAYVIYAMLGNLDEAFALQSKLFP